MSRFCTPSFSVATRFPHGVEPLKYSPPSDPSSASDGCSSTAPHIGLNPLLVWLNTMSRSTARPCPWAASTRVRSSSGPPKSRSTEQYRDGS